MHRLRRTRLSEGKHYENEKAHRVFDAKGAHFARGRVDARQYFPTILLQFLDRPV